MIRSLKFGGTSVGSADGMRQVAKVIQHENATVTVLSAMSGTTDSLIAIAKDAAQEDTIAAQEAVKSLCDKYKTCIEELLTGEREKGYKCLEKSFDTIKTEIENYRGDISDHTIIAQGELLTSAIFSLHLKEIGLNVELLHAPDFMHSDEDKRVDVAFLKKKLSHLDTSGKIYYVTQGFICTNNFGELDNLGRGGSDYSAALIGAALEAGEVQIWTDIDGMHNNDPRIVSNTRPIRNMSFDEAAELAYFGAKILHPATILPCKHNNIPVLLKNTMDPKALGTKISTEKDESLSFHAVAAKDGITVIRIYSTRMLMAYGFLRKVFEVFENHKTPIDMITTSEVAVSLTVDNDTHVEQIAHELKEFGLIEIERNNSIVCIVGHMDHDQTGLAAKVFDCLEEIPVKMISYGASHSSMAILIATEHKKITLQSLNDGLF